MKTETKVIIGISLVTILIMVGGIYMFNGKVASQQAVGDYSKYIETGLSLDLAKLNRPENPKITGPATASTTASTTPIHITEFLDYECPACAVQGESLTKQLLAKYGSRVTITRKIFPIHGQPSIDVARIVLASQIFGGEVYQNVHMKVFETQGQWAILGKKDRDEFIKKLIVGLGVDYDKLYAESTNKKYDEQIAQDKQDANDLGIKATPTFVIENYTRITGGLPLEAVVKYIDTK